MSGDGEKVSGSLPPPNGDSQQKNPWEQALNEMDAPKKNEIGLATVIERSRKFSSDFQQKLRGGFTSQDILDSIKKDIDFEDPVIRGPVEVAKGERMILALNSVQMMALGDVFNFSSSDYLGSTDLYALLESTGNDPKKVEAILKYAPIKPKTENHLIVSSALAKELGVGDQKKDIRILDVYKKAADVDLDKL